MALHFKLNPLFDSISGTISRKRFPDGHVETIVATKKGTLYTRKWYPPNDLPRRRPLLPKAEGRSGYPPKPSSGGSRE